MSQSGGYFVTIYGFGFSNVTELSCWFDEVPVPAVVSSPGELFCKTPAWTQPQFVNVSVNGRGSLSFEYLSPLSIQRVYPTVGLVSTAFMVSVQADGLMQTAICKVNDIETDCLLEELGLCKCVIFERTTGFYNLELKLHSELYFASSIEIVESCRIVLCFVYLIF